MQARKHKLLAIRTVCDECERKYEVVIGWTENKAGWTTNSIEANVISVHDDIGMLPITE
jgi:hypothetical protein